MKAVAGVLQVSLHHGEGEVGRGLRAEQLLGVARELTLDVERGQGGEQDDATHGARHHQLDEGETARRPIDWAG